MSALAQTLRWPRLKTDTLRLALWTAQDIAEATGGTASWDFQVSGVEMDSRDVQANEP